VDETDIIAALLPPDRVLLEQNEGLRDLLMPGLLAIYGRRRGSNGAQVQVATADAESIPATAEGGGDPGAEGAGLLSGASPGREA